MEDLSQYFPEGVSYRIMLDTTDYVTESIDEVLVTFLETTLIVMAVILLFLQSWRAVIIPMITIPVSLIATFAVMKLLGFSLNTLTLSASCWRLPLWSTMQLLSLKTAPDSWMKGNSLRGKVRRKPWLNCRDRLSAKSSCCSRFYPYGIYQRHYRRTLQTVRAHHRSLHGILGIQRSHVHSRHVRPVPAQNKQTTFFLYRWFNTGWAWTTDKYMQIVSTFLRRPWVALGIFFILTIAAFWGFLKWPTSYVPEEDMGYFMTSVQLPTGASLERTDRIVRQVSDSISSLPQVKGVISISGMSFLAGGAGSNLGSMFVVLKPWKERKGKENGINAVIAKVNEMTAPIQEAITFSINPPAIPGLGMTSGLQMQLLDINNLGAKEMEQAIDEIRNRAAADPRIRQITSLYQGSVPQYQLVIDRDRVKCSILHSRTSMPLSAISWVVPT